MLTDKQYKIALVAINIAIDAIKNKVDDYSGIKKQNTLNMLNEHIECAGAIEHILVTHKQEQFMSKDRITEKLYKMHMDGFAVKSFNSNTFRRVGKKTKREEILDAIIAD